LAAAERKKLPRQARSALRRRPNLDEVVVERRMPVDARQRHVRVVQNDRKQVVEIMGDAARQLTYGLEFLRSPYLIVGSLSLRGIDCGDAELSADGGSRDGHLQVPRRGGSARRGSQHHLAGLVRVARAGPRDRREERRPVRIGNERREAPADERRAIDSEHARAGQIRLTNRRVGGDREVADGCKVVELPVQLARRLGLPA
jgi:hypothetical protein